jgi:hypothetical protein
MVRRFRATENIIETQTQNRFSEICVISENLKKETAIFLAPFLLSFRATEKSLSVLQTRTYFSLLCLCSCNIFAEMNSLKYFPDLKE